MERVLAALGGIGPFDVVIIVLVMVVMCVAGILALMEVRARHVYKAVTLMMTAAFAVSVTNTLTIDRHVLQYLGPIGTLTLWFATWLTLVLIGLGTVYAVWRKYLRACV